MPKEYGYAYPDEIFNNMDVLIVESREQELYIDMLGSNPTLGRGELVSVAVCMNRSAIFATLDENAMWFARARDVPVLHIHTVLKMLLKTELCSKKDVMDIIKKIEKTDRRTIELKLVLVQV